jgi:hypothetical protein
MLRIYWAIAEPDPTVNPKNLRANIAYNTLAYNFARMLLLPHIGGKILMRVIDPGIDLGYDHMMTPSS